MPTFEETPVSCGLLEMYSLESNPESNIIQLVEYMYDNIDCRFDWTAAFVVWSDVFRKNSRGNKLYHFIKKKWPKSNIVRTAKSKNPNSDNEIAVYVWRIPRRLLQNWAKDNYADRFVAKQPKSYMFTSATY